MCSLSLPNTVNPFRHPHLIHLLVSPSSIVYASFFSCTWTSSDGNLIPVLRSLLHRLMSSQTRRYFIFQSHDSLSLGLNGSPHCSSSRYHVMAPMSFHVICSFEFFHALGLLDYCIACYCNEIYPNESHM